MPLQTTKYCPNDPFMKKKSFMEKKIYTRRQDIYISIFVVLFFETRLASNS